MNICRLDFSGNARELEMRACFNDEHRTDLFSTLPGVATATTTWKQIIFRLHILPLSAKPILGS